MDHDAHAKVYAFKEGDTVYIHCFDGKNNWLPGTIINKQGPLTFRIILDDDRVVQHYIDHIRSREYIDLPVGTTARFDDVYYQLPQRMMLQINQLLAWLLLLHCTDQ